ncbi:unnamed protein product [Protopolystoma xenopodis]|uniref:Uncharacterized protein n=1 Tax=Protopolystoma xenopodis TaxID=117903 RepID=A0A3S5ATG0_9PLAT|nr:unnamed protein product [Protopolystoma xenopodis]
MVGCLHRDSADGAPFDRQLQTGCDLPSGTAVTKVHCCLSLSADEATSPLSTYFLRPSLFTDSLNRPKNRCLTVVTLSSRTVHPPDTSFTGLPHFRPPGRWSSRPLSAHMCPLLYTRQGCVQLGRSGARAKTPKPYAWQSLTRIRPAHCDHRQQPSHRARSSDQVARIQATAHPPLIDPALGYTCELVREGQRRTRSTVDKHNHSGLLRVI